MKKFVVSYYMNADAAKVASKSTPEEREEGMKPWMAWKERIGDGLVDMGTPLMNGQSVSQSGTSPSDKEMAGYSILQAENMEGALEMVKDHPHLAWSEGCSIEVHESMPLPGM